MRDSSRSALHRHRTAPFKAMFITWAVCAGFAILLWWWTSKSQTELLHGLDSTRHSVSQLSESAKAGASALENVGQLRDETESLLTRLNSLEKGLGDGALANDGASQKAVEGAKVIALVAQATTCRERLQKLKSLDARWQAKSATLLTGDLGRRIAASPAHLELVLGMLASERPTTDQLRQWEEELQLLATPVEQAANDKRSLVAIIPQHADQLASLDQRVASAFAAMESQQLLLEAIDKETTEVTAGTTTLEQVVRERRAVAEKALAERLNTARAAAREEVLKTEEQRIVKLQREVTAAETELDAAKLAAERDKLRDETKTVEEAARVAQLEREFERVRPQVVEYLAAFTYDGFAFRADKTKGPVSLSFIDGQGALQPNRDGYEKLSRLISYNNDRPRGPIPHHIELFGMQGSLAAMERAQGYLKRYGEIMVKKGLLAR